MANIHQLGRILHQLTEPALQKLLLEHSQVMGVEKGEIIVRQGQFVKVLPIVLSGSVRVFQQRDDREILLYYVSPGQTCMMSLTACFFNNECASQAVAAEKSEILAVPARFIAEWQRQFESWNRFVIQTFRTRYDELLDNFERVAFDTIDRRVLRYLESRKSASGSPKTQLSHQALANELGTTRVVISRILKQFEQAGRVKIYRGAVELI